MGKRILDIKDLHVIYETDEEVVNAINGLNLTMKQGETLGLVGETGAGKTSTALSIMQLLPEKVGRITRGSIVLNGKDITKATENEMRSLRGETVSIIFQDPMTSLNPLIPVGKQIEEVLLLHRKRINKVQRSRHVDKMFRMIGLQPERKNEYPHQFSGGMKQRIVIAMALACEPMLLLADEPTTALDVTIQSQVLAMMNELKDKMDTSVLLITHDLGVVAQTCDRVAIMYAGEIVEIGTVEDIFAGASHHPYTEGLFGSIPNMKTFTNRLYPIVGLMPDPTNLPNGCKFHDRCPKCVDICRESSPSMVTLGSLQIKCHLYSKSFKKEEKE